MASLISFEDWAKITHDVDVSGMTFRERKPFKKQYWVEVEKPYRESDEYIAEEKARKESEKKAELRERAAEERKFARALGLKALKGSIKQKPWGEQLSREFIEKAESEEALLLIKGSDFASHANFWINNRHMTKAAMEAVMIELVKATKAANEIGYGNPGYDEQVAIRQAALDKLN